MGRGRERSVTCEKCGRNVRRDKAVTIEKPVFTNPLERKDVVDEQYTRMLTREFSYCPSCGKHLRIYEKKIQQNIRQKERAETQARFNRPFKKFNKPNYEKIQQGQSTQVPAAPQAAKPVQEEAPAADQVQETA